jgi:hypothetical protein
VRLRSGKVGDTQANMIWRMKLIIKKRKCINITGKSLEKNRDMFHSTISF